MRQTKQKVRCLEIQCTAALFYTKKGSNTLSEEKQESDALPPRKIFKIYHLNHKI
jgi:hypothetical protein